MKFSDRTLRIAEYRRDKENCSHLGALGVQTVLKHLLQSIGRPLYYLTSCYPIHDHLYMISKRSRTHLCQIVQDNEKNSRPDHNNLCKETRMSRSDLRHLIYDNI